MKDGQLTLFIKKNFSGELNKRNNLADKLVKFSKFEIVWALASLAKLRSYQNFRKSKIHPPQAYSTVVSEACIKLCRIFKRKI